METCSQYFATQFLSIDAMFMLFYELNGSFSSQSLKNDFILWIALPTNSCNKQSEPQQNCPISPELFHITQTGMLGSFLNKKILSLRSKSTSKHHLKDLKSPKYDLILLWICLNSFVKFVA